VDWHQDLNNLDSEKSFTFWMPLQDISDETGGVSVIDMDQFEEKKWPGILNEKNYETVAIESIPKGSSKDVHMKEGDLLIFNPFLVHKSFRGKSKIRWTLIVRYDCLDTFYQITGHERKSKRFTTADPYLKAKSVKDLY
jgi:ectoine hydroxylase-related dioxygenase (phytanoyl-CoA dioxygenase family)